MIRSGSGAMSQRLRQLYEGVQGVLSTYQPQQAAIEQVYVNVNAQSTLLLGQARGAILCSLASGGLDVSEYSPASIKQMVAGSGRASKEELQMMVGKILGVNLQTVSALDASDALACAVCDAHHQHLKAIVGYVPGTQRKSARSAKSSRLAWERKFGQ